MKDYIDTNCVTMFSVRKHIYTLPNVVSFHMTVISNHCDAWNITVNNYFNYNNCQTGVWVNRLPTQVLTRLTYK